MPSQDKIRAMVDLAIYEKYHKMDVFRINNYYRQDYIFWNVLHAGIRYSCVYIIYLVVYAVLRLDILFYDINLNGIYSILYRMGIYYIVGLIIFLVIAVGLYSYRYRKAKKGMYFYASRLKRLARRYHYIDGSNIK